MPPYIRKRLPHDSPNWIKDGETYFITINCQERGRNQLAHTDTATAIKQAFIVYAESGKWFPYLAIVMPDHIHALLGLNTGKFSIKGIVSPWKAYLKKTLTIQWQEVFFEHRIRNDASFEEKAAYIRSNPVRAGLAKDASEWPYIWSGTELTASSED